MTLEIIIEVFLFGIALSMDAFAVSVTQGLTYTDINKKRGIFIALVYGVCQALFPLFGYFIVEGITLLVGSTAGAKAGEILSTIVSWISFLLLLYIGGKMLIESIKDLKKPAEEKELSKFNVKEVLIMGVATAIDALATGVAFHSGLSNNLTIFLHVTIIMACTFIISLIGIILAQQVQKLLKGKFEITGIIGGIILISLGIWIIISHYTGI